MDPYHEFLLGISAWFFWPDARLALASNVRTTRINDYASTQLPPKRCNLAAIQRCNCCNLGGRHRRRTLAWHVSSALRSVRTCAPPSAAARQDTSHRATGPVTVRARARSLRLPTSADCYRCHRHGVQITRRWPRPVSRFLPALAATRLAWTFATGRSASLSMQG